MFDLGLRLLKFFKRIVSVGRASGGAAAAAPSRATEPLERRVLMAATVYEAEDALRSGAAFSRDPAVGDYTGRGFVDYVNASGDYVEWTVDADAAGEHALAVRYANGSSRSRPLELRVDGEVVVGQVAFAATGSWGTWRTETQRVTLSAGSHTVRLTAVGSSGPNVDSLAVESDPTTPPPPPPPSGVLEAEAARFEGPTFSANKDGYTGAGYVDFERASGDYVEWVVNAASDQQFDLAFRFANGSAADRPLEVAVNGQVVTASLSFGPTGTWEDWSNARVEAALRAGANTVRLSAVGAGGPNVDSLTATPQSPDQEVRSVRAYHIGNSVTNTTNFAAVRRMAAGDGRVYVWGRHVTSGAPLSWIWDHPDGGNKTDPYGRYVEALTQHTWDAMTLQPFDRQLYSEDGSGDVQAASRFIDLALEKSPDLQVYVLQRWPRRTLLSDGSYAYDYEKLWTRTYTGKWDKSNESRDYFEQVTRELREKYEGKISPVRTVPVGEVMFELNRLIEAGEVQGIDSIQDLFFDGIHLTNWGGLIVGTTLYATMYQRDPRSLNFKEYDVLDDPWDRPISEDFGRTVQQVAWDVVRNHPLTGFDE